MLGAILIAAMTSQTLTAVLKPGQPFQVSWDQPGDDPGYSYRLWCNDKIVRNFTKADITKSAPNAAGETIITANVPDGLPGGNYNCSVSAFNTIGESEKGAPAPLMVGTIPATPLRLRLVVTTGPGGGVQ